MAAAEARVGSTQGTQGPRLALEQVKARVDAFLGLTENSLEETALRSLDTPQGLEAWVGTGEGHKARWSRRLLGAEGGSSQGQELEGLRRGLDGRSWWRAEEANRRLVACLRDVVEPLRTGLATSRGRPWPQAGAPAFLRALTDLYRAREALDPQATEDLRLLGGVVGRLARGEDPQPNRRQRGGSTPTDISEGRTAEATATRANASGTARHTRAREEDGTTATPASGRGGPEVEEEQRGPGQQSGGGFDAIDDLTTEECIRVPPGMRIMETVPHHLWEDWATAVRDVYALYDRATTDAERDRALRWVMFHTQLLLYVPPRAGKKHKPGRKVAARFKRWRNRDMGDLITHWRKDRAAWAAVQAKQVARPGGRNTVEQRERTVERAAEELGHGGIRKAGRLMESLGMADTSDPAVLEQLRSKHPARREGHSFPQEVMDYVQEEEMEVMEELHEVIEGLPVDREGGPEGGRYGHLKLLASQFAPAGTEAITLMSRFVGDLVNDRMPDWFKEAWQQGRLVAPIKRLNETDPNGTPDARPVVLAGTLARVVDKAVLKQYLPAYVEALSPQQLGVGVHSAAEKLVIGIRLALQSNPGFIIVKIDLENAFNSIYRTTLLARHLKHPKLRELVPYLRTKLCPKAVLLAGQDTVISEEGVQQGLPLSSAAFALGIHDEVVAADELLATEGGAARFGQDDGYFFGPPDVVLEALARFEQQIVANTGCKLTRSKCWLYAQGNAVPENCDIPAGSIQEEDGTSHYGITVYNVPIGEPGYVREALREKAERNADTIRLYQRDWGLRPHELWTMTYYSLQHRITYWLRNLTPDETEEFARHFDAAILECAETATNNRFDPDTLPHDRLFLPTRLKGAGLRRADKLRRPAFVGALLDVLPAFIDRVDPEDGSVPGLYHEQLKDLIQEGAYDEGGHRQTHFLSTDNPYAAALATAWTDLRDATRALRGGNAAATELGPLAKPTPADAIGPRLADALDEQRRERGGAGEEAGQQRETVASQRTLTQTLESARAAQLHTRFMALDPQDRNRTMWHQLDDYSSAWAWALPLPHLRLSAQQFPEVASAYLLAESPALKGLHGQPISQNFNNRKQENRTIACDPYGDALCQAHLPGGGWTKHHNAVQYQLLTFGKRMGLHCDSEAWQVYSQRLPRDNLNPQASASRLRHCSPDLLIDVPVTYTAKNRFKGGGQFLGELKTVNPGARYNSAAVRNGTARAVDVSETDAPG